MPSSICRMVWWVCFPLCLTIYFAFSTKFFVLCRSFAGFILHLVIPDIIHLSRYYIITQSCPPPFSSPRCTFLCPLLCSDSPSPFQLFHSTSTPPPNLPFIYLPIQSLSLNLAIYLGIYFAVLIINIVAFSINNSNAAQE